MANIGKRVAAVDTKAGLRVLSREQRRGQREEQCINFTNFNISWKPVVENRRKNRRKVKV